MRTARILTTAAAILLAIGAVDHAQGQGLLKRLGSRVADKVADAVLGPEEKPQDRPQGRQQPSEAAANAFGLGGMMQQDRTGDSGGQTPERINPTSLVKTRLAATASWDDVVTPSSASTLDGLIRELPGLPTVADLVNPDAEKRAAYYRKIAAVNARVDQLAVEQTCTQGEQDTFLEKLYAEQAARFGLTAAELKALDSGELSPAEAERLQERILEALLGGGNMAGLMAMAAEGQTKLDAEGNMSQEDAMALLAKHGGSLNIGEMMAAGQSYAAEMERMNKLHTRLLAIERKMGGVTALGSRAQYGAIAAKYDSDLAGMYTDLCAATTPGAVDAIYEKADALVRNYRREAATAWLAELQGRMESLAAVYPEMLALEADMVAEGLMAPCAQRVSSLNIVSRFANILDGAYRDFPQTEMLPVCREVILTLPENESLFTTESAMATTVEGFLHGSEIMVYNSADGKNYVYEGGQKRPLGPNEPADLAAQRERPRPTYGHWTSTNGMRSVDYQPDGALMLHDGTIFYPLAFEIDGNVATWISHIDNRLEKCTYKL